VAAVAELLPQGVLMEGWTLLVGSPTSASIARAAIPNAQPYRRRVHVPPTLARTLTTSATTSKPPAPARLIMLGYWLIRPFRSTWLTKTEP
jgi:hypothetical protein